jgi:hypothetical protein
MKMAATPHWSLERVRELAASGQVFVQRSRALDSFDSLEEAFEAACQTLVGLTEDSFSHTVDLTWDVADVYGVVREDGGWYLKICIDEEEPEVAVISFHRLERPLRTRAGVVRP